jgi:heptosyltransferase-3
MAFAPLVRMIPGTDGVVCVENLDEMKTLMPALSNWHTVDLTLRGKRYSDNIREWEKTGGDTSVTTENYYLHGTLLQAMCKSAGVSVLDERPELRIPKESFSELPSGLAAGNYVVFHCRSEEAARNWNAEGWRSLAEALLNKGLTVVEIGHAPSGCLSQREGYLNLTGKTSIRGSAALIKQARLFIGIDSGPAHIANALETPGLILLGRYRIFGQYMPYTGAYASGRGLILQHSEECPFLPTERALAALGEALDATNAPQPPARLGIRRPDSATPLVPPSIGSTVRLGGLEILANLDALEMSTGGSCQAHGWACMPSEGRSPDFLMIGRPSDQGAVTAISVHPFSRLERPDVAAHFGNPRLGFCGLSISLNGHRPGDELYAFDSATSSCHRLARLPEGS